ncbi:MAG: HEAT repeat domain-containing protein [Gemmataceae bacterium]
MYSRLLHLSLSLFVMSAFLTSLAAQDKGKPGKPGAPPPRKRLTDDDDDYRRFFKRPTNTPEYWKAMQFEIDVGKYDLAAIHLRNLVNFKPPDADLVKLADELGVAAFLRLRNIRTWSDDAKANKEALANVETLIQRVTDAINKVRHDPIRIQAYIKNLTASPEENAYALKQLAKSGAFAVPYLIDALSESDAEERVRYLAALERLGPDTLEPMVAALDSNIPRLQVDLIRIFRKRYSRRVVELVVPNLWFLAQSRSQPDEVRRQALAALSYFLETPADKLPPARIELTRLAERYYLHRVKFADPKAVTIWRWDGKRVVAGWPGAAAVDVDKAEEYYGLRYAGQALLLDPAYTPAQVVRLSLILDKTQSKAGLDKPLERAAPKVHDLLGTVRPDLVNAVLERALEEHRVSVILGAVRDLGERKEIRAVRPMGRRQPPLVRALYYPDRRVEMAAAEALLQIPDSALSLATTRVVEVLRRAVAAEPELRQRPKVLIGYFNEDIRNRVAGAVGGAGYEAVAVASGREMMQRLGQASDIALLLFEEELPNPGLAHLLGQLRADRFASQLPILLTAAPPRVDASGRLPDNPRQRALLLGEASRREEALRRYTARWSNITVLPATFALNGQALKLLIQSRLADPANPTLSAKEMKDYAEHSIENLARLARGEIAGYDVAPAGPTVLEALRAPTKLTPKGQGFAIEVVTRLKKDEAREAQTVLANVLSDAKRTTAVRIAAANALVRNVQQFSPLLTRAQASALAALYADPKLDELIKTKVALVLGSLQPSARRSGDLLLRYQPPVPGAPPPKK